MYAKVDKKFDDAVANNAIKFTQSTQDVSRLENGLDVAYTLATALGDKPKADDSTSGKASSDKKASPWTPPSDDLLVQKLDDHSVVLNKFPVIKNHCLLVTNEPVSQTTPLSEEDLATAYELLRSFNSDSGKRHVGFFNSGPKSGASVDHKHIQFVELPEKFRPFPDSTREKNDAEVYTDERVPFAHYIRNLPNEATEEDLVFRYSQILGEILTRTFKENWEGTNSDINYNFIFTEDWMLGVPRSKEDSEDGLSINSLGTVGMFLAKNDEELNKIKEKNFELITEVGFPYGKAEKHAPDFSGYTLY